METLSGDRHRTGVERAAADGAVAYTVLMRPFSQVTVALGCCTESAIPWSLRGAQRWRDCDVVRVDHAVVTVEQALGLLEISGGEGRLADRLVDACLIRAELQRHPVEVGDDDLQRAADGLRRALRLYSVADTQVWLAQRGLNQEHFEQQALEQARFEHLRQRVVADGVEAYYAARHGEFDVATVALAECRDETDARQLAECLSSCYRPQASTSSRTFCSPSPPVVRANGFRRF